MYIGGDDKPSPRPKLFYQIISPHLPEPKIGSFFFMWPYNRCIVRRSWALSRQNAQVLSDRSLKVGKAKEPVHGDDFSYEESMETGSTLKAYLISWVIMIFGLLFFGSSLVSQHHNNEIYDRRENYCYGSSPQQERARRWKSSKRAGSR